MDAADSNPRSFGSRLTTAMGCILLLLAVNLPIRLLWEVSFLNPFLRMPLGTNYRIPQGVDLSLRSILGCFTAWAGVAIIRRRHWGLLIACCTGGASLGESVVFLNRYGRVALTTTLGTWNTPSRDVGLKTAVPLLTESLTTLIWLLTLACLLCRPVRNEFAAPENRIPLLALCYGTLLSGLVFTGLRMILTKAFWFELPGF